MSLQKGSSESMQTTEDNNTIGDSGEHSLLEEEEDDGHTDDDDDDDSTSDSEEDDDDDEDSGTTGTEDGDTEDERYNDYEHDDESFLVPIEKNRSPNKLERSEKQQAQQRRLVLNLAASSSGTSHDGSTTVYDEDDEEEEDCRTEEGDLGNRVVYTTTGTDAGVEEGYSTTGGNSTTTNDAGDRGGYTTEGGNTTEGGYTTAGTGTVSGTGSDDSHDVDTFDDDENETDRDYSAQENNTISTGEFGQSGSTYSMASQSTATTQPTSPSRKKKNLTLTNEDGDDDLAGLATPDIHNRSSFLQSSVTPRTGHVKVLLPSASTISSQHVSPRGLKERVPGGAAAKLMLLGPKDSKESEESQFIERMSSTESSVKINPGAVLAAEMERVKEEFATGTVKLDRTKMGPPSNLNDVESNLNGEVESYTKNLSMKPSFLNRSEIFHQTATDAVAALLKPRQSSDDDNDGSLFSCPRSSSRGVPKTLESVSNNSLPTDPSNANPVVSLELISKETERKVEAMEAKMLHPTNTLTDLLTAIATPDGPIPDQLAYSVRRKNACGALLTLTTTAENRVRIGWTAGVLPALKSVLSDGLIVDGESSSPFFQDDVRIRSEYDAARNRAISTIMNLSMPVKNRIAVFHSPGLIQAVLSTMEQDHGVARKGCTAILAFLAKSTENRLLMAQIPGLMDLVRKVLKPRPSRVEVATASPMKEKKSYPWSDDDDASTTSSSDKEGSMEGTENDRNRSQRGKSKPGLSFVTTASSFHSYDDSGETPKVEGANSPREVSGYDETADEFLQAARQNVFAMLGHLVKEKDNAYHFARDLNFVSTMVDISLCHESPSHALAVKILANLTRHRLNKVLAFKPKTVVPALVEATQSTNDDARLYACYAIQNLSQEKSCRQELAIAEHLIEALCDRCRNGTLDAERLAAVSTLKNLCDEPANLIPLTNTPGCVTTLMHLAHAATPFPRSTAANHDNPTDDFAPPPPPPLVITELMQYRACDALATLSHWLRKIATSGHSLDATQKGRLPNKGLFVPSLREVSWDQWS